MTIAIAAGRGGLGSLEHAPRRRRRWRRILLWSGAALATIIAVVGAWLGLTLYRIDHAVHHVGVPASLLAKGKNDLLAIVKGPDHTEQIFVFHNVGGHTNVLKIPDALSLPLKGGTSARIDSLSVHAPSTIIGGLHTLGIPVTHYVGVDLHTVDPNSSLGKLATGKMSVSSMISDPTGTTSILEQVASHVYLGPGTPVSAVLSLMNVPTAHPLNVPTAKDGHGQVVPGSTFTAVLRSFL
ncbi:MAG TPA: hypothetical protein VHD39_04655 [Acidimicrobiales bacterium]|nr:hypothetical protein [Acidimicrobiales bacterium]